jgi:hypothetical protein
MILRRRLRNAAVFAVLVAFVGVRTSTPVYAGGEFSTGGIGTAGSEFLNIDVGARAISMGGAFTAATDDAYAMYWNPAGLSQISRASAGAMHNEYLAGIRFQYLTYAQRIADHSVMAGSFRFMDIGKITQTDISGNTVGTFRPRSFVFEGGMGKNIPDLTDSERDVSIGVAGRFFRSAMVEQASGYAVDLGIQIHYTETYAPYNFGFVVQNIGRGQKFDEVRDTLPTRMKLGVSIRPKQEILFALDGVMPVSGQPYLALGTEFEFAARDTMKVFLRGGYTMRDLATNLEGLRGLRFGLGAKFSDFSFDYAWSPLGQIGTAHLFSVGWNLPTKRSRSYRRR